jgi:hypothetical protein
VHPFQSKACLAVVEQIGGKKRYLSIPSFVFGVTNSAILALRYQTMKSGFFPDVPGDLFVTLQTKGRLGTFLKIEMAASTCGFQF